MALPTVKENPNFEVLYWVGCAGSYDRRAQRVARAFVKLLKHAGVNFAILGREEKCTGESARRLGDEFLFQELAQANIATLARYNVRRIVTHCPHCLNSLLRDYPQFGGNYEVVHHTQFLEQLLTKGRLVVAGGVSPEAAMTYHDPCYLARVNGVHQPPRNVLTVGLGRDVLAAHRFSRNAAPPGEDLLLRCGRRSYVDGGRTPKARLLRPRQRGPGDRRNDGGGGLPVLSHHAD